MKRALLLVALVAAGLVTTAALVWFFTRGDDGASVRVATTSAPVSTRSTPAATVGRASSSGPLLPAELIGAEDADQVITVVANVDDQSRATFNAYERVDGAWQLAFGPWDANVGTNGFAPIGEKREGDGRTPSGVYGFDFAFGVQPDPGVRLSYREITGPSIVWDDDPSSEHYNEWVDTDTTDAGVDPEPMDNEPAYSYGAVIAYNDDRTPGLGSAIFLHVSTGSATLGCVSLPESQLLDVLRWLDPSARPRIALRAPTQ